MKIRDEGTIDYMTCNTRLRHVAALLLLSTFRRTVAADVIEHEYCIIGSGPGGLQLGHLLLSTGRDFIIFEKGETSGNFFKTHPVHRTLISLNKKYTG